MADVRSKEDIDQILRVVALAARTKERRLLDLLPVMPGKWRCVKHGHEQKAKRVRCGDCGSKVVRRSARCRLCLGPVGKGLRSWCSGDCRHKFNLATSRSYLRLMVYQRDVGVCAECEIDCRDLEVRVYGYDTMMKLPKPSSMVRRPMVEAMERLQAMEHVLLTHGFDAKGYRSFWDADHIEALEDGGSWQLENAQTLCQPDHKKKTAEHATRRAKRKRLVGHKHVKDRRRRLHQTR